MSKNRSAEIFLQVNELISSSKRQMTFPESETLLLKALNILCIYDKEGKLSKSNLLKSKIYVELANNNNDPTTRRKFWKTALSISQKEHEFSKSTGSAISYANIVLDSSQDIYSRIYEHIISKNLAIAKKTINNLLHSDEDIDQQERSSLLSRMSAILRMQAFYIESIHHKVSTLQKAKRAALKSLEMSTDDSWSMLELANCYWALARFSKSDKEYNSMLLEAEKHFKNSSVHNNEIAALGLSKFYRLTYQASKACDVFLATTTFALDKRRLLRESYVLAESVQYLWYAKYPKRYVYGLLGEAIGFLEKAINAGYNHARLIVDLAMLHAMKGDIASSNIILTSELLLKDKISFNWNAVIEFVLEDKSDISLARKGFSLGLTNENTLNRLGTYFKDFSGDYELALTFYKTALSLSPNNSAVLNNTANLMIDLSDGSDFDEIHRLINKSKNLADRRFNWWQQTQNKLNKIKGVSLLPKAKAIKVPRNPFKSFYDRRLEFYRIKKINDKAKRGKEFENYVNKLISISFTESIGSHSLPGMEVDGFFIHRSLPFRVEVKWKGEKLEAKYIREFTGRLQLASLNGVFVSMSGFSNNAIAAAKQHMNMKVIILLNRNDIMDIVEGAESFNTLIDKKFWNFYTKENII